MKSLLTFILVFITLYSSAATYYLSDSQGDDTRTSTQAQNQSTPWKTLAKINATTFVAGDNILLKRGDTFSGSIITTTNGTSVAPIIIDAYGTGANPIISGFSPVTSWTSLGGGIYESNAFTPQSAILMVVLDNKIAQKGRYPNVDASNGGYLSFEAFDNTAKTITDNQLATTSITSSYIGATLTTRSTHYTLDRGTISGVNTGTGVITYTDATMLSHPSKVGYGYFVSNSFNTLDQYGEWYYNPSTQKIDMYFGSKNPDLHDVKVTTIDALISPRHSYYTIQNIDIQGANKYGIASNLSGVTTLNIKKCNINFCGEMGVALNNRANPVIDSCTISNCSSIGINYGNHNDNPKVLNSTIKNIGTIASNLMTDLTYQGRYAYGIFSSSPITTGITVMNCQLSNIGYMGIFFDYSNNFIYKNYVNTTNFIMDDGGGIYTGNAQLLAQVNNIIRRNIVINTMGATAGTTDNTGWGNGIYLDDNSVRCTVDSNTVVNSTQHSMFLHNAANCAVRKNLFIDGKRSQVAIGDDDIGGRVQNDTITNNTLFSKSNTEDSYWFTTVSAGGGNNGLTQFGVIDNNILCNPFTTTSFAGGVYSETGKIAHWDDFSVAGVNDWSLSEWRVNTPYDDFSTQTAIPVTSNSNIFIRYSIDGDQNIKLSANYKQVDGTVIGSNITIQDHIGTLLIQ